MKQRIFPFIAGYEGKSESNSKKLIKGKESACPALGRDRGRQTGILGIEGFG
jgi:hypothetical protein